MFLRIYVAVLSMVVVVLATAAFRQAARPQNLGEITVERINVVDANGTLRMVISNKDRMHPGVIDGVTIERERSVAGLIFFNDTGDEMGGLTYGAQVANGQRSGHGAMTFDQLKQDQTIGFRYAENNDGRRSAALEVWDRPDASLADFIKRFNAANRIANPVDRQNALRTLESGPSPAPRRVFVGKDIDRASHVTLSDANGKPRLKLTVEAGGDARIEFLDENGKVTGRLPQVQ